MSQSPTQRKSSDLMRLMMKGYAVEMIGESTHQFEVTFIAPAHTPYEGGVYKVLVTLPDAYPYSSPSIGFKNKIFHPNIDERSGSVCLDVINQTWTPLYSLVNIFDVFLPQLLQYPNPDDPLNGEAAALMMKSKDEYLSKIREYVRQHATPAPTSAGDAEDDPMSDMSELSAADGNDDMDLDME
eukprot:CAMPEP_0204324068 /NCGR_PEP_ID=MMETSP0469-20131031/9923_1 /ASSEMBLY_ACC=CAM_ASM_000384 /TAXON_ID=2969 /ORGANISM="Oxyrrhis marina" /LENGTH=183 /DNA_ID=CAMNT_0051305647 /DNA_START=54 /DNA_END=605 /DNA_ORIENTATION=-